MSGWDISKLGDCPAHGRYAGKECPLCDGTPPPVSVATEAAPVEYDRSNWYRGPEKDLHEWFETEMIRLGVAYIHGRMDKESTIRKGWPDFTCIRRAEDGIVRACLVELKSKNTPVLVDQVKVHAELRISGIPVMVTGDFREAVEFVKTHLFIRSNELPDTTTPNDVFPQ